MLIEGVGYFAPPGTCYWIWPGSRESAGTTPFNPAAGNPFGTGPGGVLDDAVFNARYGGRPIRFDGTVGNLVVDAETITGALTRAMELLAKKGEVPEFTGRPETHTLVPTIMEAHDWAATHTDGGQALMAAAGVGAPGGGATPGIPRIEELTSPAPGQIALRWITRQGHSEFEVEAGEAVYRFPGSVFAAVLDLPAGVGGEIPVRVRAYLGGAPGRWGLTRTVSVAPREGEVVPPEKPPEPPIEPPVEPPKPDDTECRLLLAKAALELQEARTALEVKTGENERLATDLREALGNLRDCQVERDRLGLEVDALGREISRLRALVSVVVPVDIQETMEMAGRWSGAVWFGAGLKARLGRLRRFIEGLKGRTA